jgi:hypothetical protein
VNTPKEEARREIRRQMNEEVYPVLEGLAQALERLPEDAADPAQARGQLRGDPGQGEDRRDGPRR